MTEDVQVDPHGLRELLDNYLSRAEAAWPGGQAADWAREFLRRFKLDRADEVCLLGAACMRESLTDGKRHSTAVANSDIFVSISTFPCGLEEARTAYFANGYFDYLNSILRVALTDNPRNHFVHILFFCDRKNCWAQFTLFPNRDNLGFDPLYSLPDELLSESERRQVGLA
ncbi:hypothetical protein KQH82_13470 [bacterium]|nr:hypothetical protein [bacterium]